MRSALLVLALAAACQPGVEQDQLAVVGGTADTTHASVVAVVKRRATCDAPEDLHCSGVLIAPRAVLTAAHCLDDREADELEVVIGDDVAAPSSILAVWRGELHPDEEIDLAVLTLEADPGVTPAVPADLAPAELVEGATVRVVGFGTTGTPGTSGTRRGADATIATLDPDAIGTDATGVPCGGDSGGALFLATAGGERLVGIVKASDAACTTEGLAMRVDTAAAFLADALAVADATTSSGRPPFDAEVDHCGDTCEVAADCPVGMLCLPERDAMHCGYREGRVTAFGEACADGAACVAVGEGSERDCRLASACAPDGDEPGCCSAGGGDPPIALLILAVGLLARRREL